MKFAPSERPSGLASIGFVAGVLGAAIMTLLTTLARATGATTLNIELLLGSFITGSTGSGSWVIGLTWHLLNGGIFGVIYAVGLREFWLPRHILREASVNRASPIAAAMNCGAAMGVVHWLVASLLLGGAAIVHPLIPMQIATPGYFGAGMGAFTALAFLAEHVLFGAVVGAAVGSFLNPALVGRITDTELPSNHESAA